MKPARLLPLVLALSLAPLPVFAEDEDEAAELPARPLPTLPVPPSIDLPDPDAATRAALDAWLERLTSDDEKLREAAVAEIEGTSRAMLPAIAAKIEEIREGARTGRMAALLTEARKLKMESPDWFERVMAAPNPKDPAWRDLASLLGMSRRLVEIGTTPAVRELVALYPAFDELLRIDIQRQLVILRDKAYAPLIEARRGETRQLRIWAGRQLDAIGGGTPGEAVQSADEQLLPDILRAYGRSRDGETARVVLSFANSDRTQVREAAREAVVMFSDNALWPLREAYEALLGHRASEDWNWERTARELFAAFDQARLADVYAQLDQGLKAEADGQLDEMVASFDAVLARAPRLDRRTEMASGYEVYARSLLERDPARALEYFRRALRLDPPDPLASTIGAEIAFLEAEQLASRGLIEEAAYRRALELNPQHPGALEALEGLDEDRRKRRATLRNYGGLAALAFGVLMTAPWIVFRRRRAPSPKRAPAS